MRLRVCGKFVPQVYAHPCWGGCVFVFCFAFCVFVGVVLCVFYLCSLCPVHPARVMPRTLSGAGHLAGLVVVLCVPHCHEVMDVLRVQLHLLEYRNGALCEVSVVATIV